VVKSLGYGTMNMCLVEDSVKRDENWAGVMGLDLDDQVEDAPEGEAGVCTGTGAPGCVLTLPSLLPP